VLVRVDGDCLVAQEWGRRRDSAVHITAICPGSTNTEFHGVAGEVAQWGEPPEDVVALAFDTLARRGTVIYGWFNWLRANLAMRLAPRTLVAHLGREYMRGQTPREQQ
jgi:short-subunit dehydrogenase